MAPYLPDSADLTGLAGLLGVLAMLLFGGFIGNIFAALETDAVERSGHLVVFRTGYFTFGSGRSRGSSWIRRMTS